jgi:hypothetical protein
MTRSVLGTTVCHVCRNSSAAVLNEGLRCLVRVGDQVTSARKLLVSTEKRSSALVNLLNRWCCARTVPTSRIVVGRA